MLNKLKKIKISRNIFSVLIIFGLHIYKKFETRFDCFFLDSKTGVHSVIIDWVSNYITLKNSFLILNEFN
jgi:hypothetical protein